MRNLYKLLLIIVAVAHVPAAYGQMFWNYAASFNGTSSYMAVNPSSSVNITGSFTLEAWINPASVAVDFQGIVSKGTASLRRYSLNFASTTTANRMEIATNGSQRIRSRTPIAAGVWTHVAGVYDVATNLFSVYLNGVLDTSATVAGVAPADGPTDSVFVGKTSTGRFYGGLIDDIRIWNRALTTAEIRKWMRTELGSSTGVYSGLVLSLLFQNSVNTPSFVLYDYSESGNLAANRGATAVSFANSPYSYITMNDCVLLDGTGDYLAAPSVTDLNITGSFTIECWVRPANATNPSFQILVSRRVTAGTGYDLYLNAGRVTIRTNGSTRLSGSTVIPNGYWSHVAATYNSTTNLFSVYLNGNLDGTATVTGAAPASNTDSLFIGHGFNSDYAGYIDEVRIYNTTRTQQEIRSFMTRSMEHSNQIAGSVVYNLDGIAYRNSTSPFPLLQFMGNAAFAAVSTVSNQPMSPLNRADAQNFPQGFYLKYSDRRIPQTGTSGLMIPDSIFISQSVTISDVNFYIATNHTYDADMSIVLVGPAGDSVNACSGYFMLDQNDNIITLFDDQADSSLTSSFTTVAPRVRPQQSLNSAFAGRNAQGWWRLKINDVAGGDTGRVYFWGVQINNQTLVGVEEVADLHPDRFTLEQNYPNPFNPTTTIQFSVPIKSTVNLKVFDILGREVRTLVNDVKNPGAYKVLFDGTGLASGTYFYRMEAGNYIETKKLLLLK